MITIKNEAEKVKVIVELFGWTIPFSINREDGLSAILMTNTLNEKMGNRLEMIRREAYFRGYKHGKAHQSKDTYFSKGW